MRLLFPLLTALSLTSLSQLAIGGEQQLLSLDYRVTANRPYQTDFYRVQGAPFSTSYVSIQQSGQYCDLRIEGVQYTRFEGDQANAAFSVGNQAIYKIQAGAVYGINVLFHQETWSYADCTLIVNSHVEGGDGPAQGDETLLGAIRYNGGFNNTLSLPVSGDQAIASIRVDVPTFCHDVDILNVGTVVGNVFHRATVTRDSASVFNVEAGFGRGVQSLSFALNGPTAAACDIPVFVRYGN